MAPPPRGTLGGARCTLQGSLTRGLRTLPRRQRPRRLGSPPGMVTVGGAARHARACHARAAAALRRSQVSCPAQPAITCSLSPPWASPLLGLTTIIPPLSHAPSLTLTLCLSLPPSHVLAMRTRCPVGAGSPLRPSLTSLSPLPVPCSSTRRGCSRAVPARPSPCRMPRLL